MKTISSYKKEEILNGLLKKDKTRTSNRKPNGTVLLSAPLKLF